MRLKARAGFGVPAAGPAMVMLATAASAAPTGDRRVVGTGHDPGDDGAGLVEGPVTKGQALRVLVKYAGVPSTVVIDERYKAWTRTATGGLLNVNWLDFTGAGVAEPAAP